MMNFTPEQAQAIQIHDENLIVVAGAGSGKTRVLVERYLALLDANPHWPLSALVAITFTKKAAQEMRDRVRQELEHRLNSPDQYPGTARWASLLSQIDSARIGTIHSLCADLLRANAASVGIDPDFAVLDEVESAILLEDVVDTELARLVAKGVDQLELQLLVAYSPDAIKRTLNDPALLDQPLPDDPVDWMLWWRELWDKAILAAGNRILMHEATAALYTLDGVPEGDRVGSQCYQAIQAIERLRQSKTPEIFYTAFDSLATINLQGGSSNAWGSKETLAEAKAILGAIRDEAKSILETTGAFPGDFDTQASELLPLWLRLIKRVQIAFRETKLQRATLDFDDLERLTCDMLNVHEDVRARYRGTEFKHLLVDEFQDTNARQWQIVKGLASLDDGGSMFVVGDQKQSIYAFRGADVSVFGDVRAEISGAGGQAIQMARSFRTHETLVNAFNAVFQQLLVRVPSSAAAAYQVEFETTMSANRVDAPDSRPFVEFALIPPHEVDDEGVPLQMDGEKSIRLSTEERRKWEAMEIARRIQQMIGQGYRVHDPSVGEDNTRPIAFGDFTILFQALTQVEIYENALAQQGIPYLTVAGRGYFNRQEVWDLLNLLRAVYHPYDDLALASVLRSPLFSLSDNALFALRLQTDVSDATGGEQVVPLWEAMAQAGELFPQDELHVLEFAYRCLTDLKQMAGRVTILELLNEALEQTAYLAILGSLPDGARMRENVRKLLRIAQERGQTTLAAFDTYLRDLSDREVREGEAALTSEDSVKLMTVHKSKGLEFPVVILADASWTRRGGNANLLNWDDQLGWGCKVIDPVTGRTEKTFAFSNIDALNNGRDDAERLRSLYVAATRARDYLLVSGQITLDQKIGWKSSGWLGQLMDVLGLGEAVRFGLDEPVSYGWGALRLFVPRRRPAIESVSSDLAEQVQTPTPYVTQEIPEPFNPAMIKPLECSTAQNIRHLAATQIAHLGGIETAASAAERKRYADLFRRQTLHGAPDQVYEMPIESLQRPSARQIGEIVHESLRYQQLPSRTGEAELQRILSSYGWRHSITDPVANHWAVNETVRLLRQFEDGVIWDLIRGAEAVYRELPFTLEHENYVIHGIIDVLLRRPGGQWVIVDYKTGYAPHDPQDLRVHARQYHLQVGIYALAVAAQLDGVIPDTVIYFVQNANTPVTVTEAEWRFAIGSQLDQRISQVIEGRTDA